VAFIATRGGSEPTAAVETTNNQPASTPSTDTAPVDTPTTEAPAVEEPTPETSTPAVDDTARRQVAAQLQKAINLSHKAHDAIAARPSVAGSSARLGKCIDLSGAISEMEEASSYRQEILDTLSAVDAASDWPEAATFVAFFTDATDAGLRADDKFAAWGYDLQYGCDPRSSQDNGNYRQAANLANQFSARRHLAAVEWNKLAVRYPELGLTPVPATGETL
jgi:hypothetical protein